MPKMKCEKRMKTFMSRAAILVSLAAVALVCRWKGCSRQPAGGLGVGEGPTGPAFEKSRVPPRPPSLQPANAVGEQAWQTCPSVAIVRPPHVVPVSAREMLQSAPGRGAEAASKADVVRLAAEKSQAMDDLLNAEPIPSDYGRVMVDLFRDRSRDVYTRDFAVQHIGLYAEALHRRGAYDPTSPEAAQMRRALDAAADETDAIVAAAAFRALDDLSAFDPHVEARRFEARLLSCAADASAAPAARVMAVQLCGERGVASSRSLLKRLADEPGENAVVRRSAARALHAQRAPCKINGSMAACETVNGARLSLPPPVIPRVAARR